MPLPLAWSRLHDQTTTYPLTTLAVCTRLNDTNQRPHPRCGQDHPISLFQRRRSHANQPILLREFESDAMLPCYDRQCRITLAQRLNELATANSQGLLE